MVGRPFRSGRSIVTPGVEATSDGLVGVGVGTGQQWLDFCVMVEPPRVDGGPQALRQPRRTCSRTSRRGWREHTTAEVLELAGAFRIPHAPIGNGATIPATDHFQARGSIVPNRPGRLRRARPALPLRPAAPAAAEPGPAPGRAHERSVDIAGAARTLPTSSRMRRRQSGGRCRSRGCGCWTSRRSGPGRCAPTCWRCSAPRCSTSSRPTRPDGTRLLAGLRFSEPDWWEQSGIFSGLNTGKKSVTLDLATRPRPGAAAAAASTPATSSSRTTRRGCWSRSASTSTPSGPSGPTSSWCACPASGSTGRGGTIRPSPSSSRTPPGLTWMTGHPDQNPVSPYCVGDSNAGLHALTGLLLALEHRRRTGEGVARRGGDGRRRAQRGRRAGRGALGLRRAPRAGREPRPDRRARRTSTARPTPTTRASAMRGWPSRWRPTSSGSALREALGSARLGDGPDARRPAPDGAQQHDAIDDHLATWCAERSGDEIVDRLWGAGVPVGEGAAAARAGRRCRQLQHRGFFEDVEHPVTGTARHSTLPMRFSRGPDRFHRRPAPLLGEHNDEVLRGLGRVRRRSWPSSRPRA